MACDRWAEGFRDSTRGQVAALLRGRPSTVEELARSLGLTDNAVRSHLQALTRDGIVRVAGVRRTEGAGKPATVYELAPDGEPLFSRAYVPVLEALLSATAESLGPKTRDAFIRNAAHALVEQVVASTGEPGGDPEARAVKIVEALGGMVETERDGGRTVIRGLGCPVSLVAAAHPDACRLLQFALAEVTGREVREECRRGERSRCRFVMTDTQAGSLE